MITVYVHTWRNGYAKFVSVHKTWHLLLSDLGRMYNLVSRIQDGLGELKKLLETHIHNQGLAAIEKCGEAALNVSTVPESSRASPFPHTSCRCVSYACVDRSRWSGFPQNSREEPWFGVLM